MKKIVFVIIILIVIFGLGVILYYCNFKTVLIIGNEKIEIDTKTQAEISLKTLQSETKTIVKKEGVEKVEINNQEIKEQLDLGMIQINKENKLEVIVTNFFGRKKTYYINTLPEDFPEYKIEGESQYEGDYYFTTYNNLKEPFYLFKLDEKGNILYYRNTDQVTFDFKKYEIDNKTLYTYLEAVNGEMDFESVSYCPCKLVIMNDKYEVIDEKRYINEDGSIQPLENHGGLVIGEDNYILTSLKEMKVDNIPQELDIKNNKVTNNLIEEVENGKIKWIFQTIDYPELYKYSSLYNGKETLDENQYIDYIHYNSCAIDKNDGNLLCSFRNIDAILKINRQTGKLMWILGGKGDYFNLTEKQKFEKQHAITVLDDNSLVIFDNGSYTENSRIIKLKLDEVNKKILEYEDINLKVNSYFMGSAIPIDENQNIYSICYGGGYFKNPVFQEKNIRTNEIYFSLDLKNSKFLYRVYKIK